MTSAAAPTFDSALARMSRVEWRIGCRSLAWRLFMALTFIYGLSIGYTDGRGAGGVAYATAQAGWQIVSLLAIVWMSLLGHRESSLRTKTIVFVKPQPAETLALARFIGGMAQTAAFLVSLFVGAAVMRLFSGSSIIMVSVFVPQLLRAFAVVFFVSALSYTLSLLSDSVIAGTLVGLYVVLEWAGKSFLAKYYDPSPVQHSLAYVALGCAVICLALRFYGKRRRGSARAPRWIAATGLAMVGISAWQFWLMYTTGYDPQVHEIPALNLMQSQDSNVGLRAAGFLLPDQNGDLTGIAQYTGKIMVIALWSPLDPDSAQLLQHLKSVQKQYGPSGVRVISVCLSEDNSAARTFAVGEDVQFPVVTDWGTTSVPEKLAMSPIASAWRTSVLPMVAVTDRRRRVTAIVRGVACYEGVSMDTAIRDEVVAEPK